MERFIAAGMFDGVLDMTTHELLAELYPDDIYTPVRPGRLTAAGALGLPQVVVPGGLEYHCFAAADTIPVGLRGRLTHFHNPNNTNVRSSAEELIAVARAMAERLNAATGPVSVLIPSLGWSQVGSPGGPLHDLETNAAFVGELRRLVHERVAVRELPIAINDDPFGTLAAEELLSMLACRRAPPRSGRDSPGPNDERGRTVSQTQLAVSFPEVPDVIPRDHACRRALRARGTSGWSTARCRGPARRRCSCGWRPAGRAAPTSRSSTVTSRRRRRSASSPQATSGPGRSSPPAPASTSSFPGDRVCIEAHKGCGRCDNCVVGKYTACLNYNNAAKGHRATGMTANGGFAEYVIHHVAALYKMPPQLTAEDAVLITTAGTGLFGIDTAGGYIVGQNVVVYGPGRGRPDGGAGVQADGRQPGDPGRHSAVAAGPRPRARDRPRHQRP